jgi:hypothetical protein
MAYLGRAPANGFHAKQQISGDGSTTSFALDYTVAHDTAILVSVNGTILEPAHGFSLTGGGTNIVFTSAPASNVRTYVQFLGIAISTNFTSLLGASFILDADGDTSFTADTDDEIDIEVGGSDRSTIKADGFHNLDSIKYVAGTGDDMSIYHDGTNSFITNTTGALKLATETSGIAVSIGHSTSEVTIGDNLTVTGTLTVGGTVNFGDFNITNVGSIALDTITNDGTDITLDSSGDIILDSDGADVIFKDAGTEISRFTNSSSDFIIKSAVSNKDMLFKGNDGGAEVTALTLDMSAAGAATFNDKIVATELDISGDCDIDGTTNLDVVDIDGAVNIAAATTMLGTLTIGANDAGHDVILYGDTASANLTWDTSEDDLIANGATRIVIPDGQLVFGSTAVTSTAAELNLLDGVSGLAQADFTKLAAVDATAAEIDKLDGATVTTAEINIIDGDTSATSTTVADADRVVMNDNGTMVQVAVTDLAAYFDDEITAMPNLTSVGTLTALTVDDVAVNGKVITMTGSSGDTFTTTVGTNGATTLTTVDTAAAAANITITADGTAELAGTTVTLNSSGGVTLDADNGTITFADAGSSLGTITSSGYSGTAAVATAVTITDNESTNENNAIIFTAGGDTDGGNLGLESDGDLTYNPSTGTLSVTNIVTSGTHTVTNSVTMNASNAVVFEGATADAHETTLSSIDATGDRTINLPNVSGTLPVLAAASTTQITSTPEEINLIDGGTARGTTALASGDGILINDGGTMRMTNVDTVRTYMEVDSLQLAGGTLTGDLNLGDNVDINIGSGTDLKIYHDGSHTRVQNNTGNLNLRTAVLSVTNVADNETILSGTADGSVDLYYNNSKKFETTNAGVAVTGTLIPSGVLTANAGVVVDNITIDGTQIDLSSGDLTIDVAGDIILDADGGDVEFHDGGTKFASIELNSTEVYFESHGSDHDIKIRGNDGGSTINAVSFDMSAAGAATFNNDVTAFSDARLKENVETIDNALDKVCAMRGVTFNRIDNEDGGRQMGVIAQEVQDIVPEVVKTNDDEDKTLSVSYGNMVGVLIEAIKELKEEIKELKGE